MSPNEIRIDKSTWGPGPWQNEPDRVEFEHSGLPCLMLRHEMLGHWCGYAAVSPGHPLYGKGYDDVDVTAHGGLTYSGHCRGHICHTPKDGEPENVWWFGFDCGHTWDTSPGMESKGLTVLLPLLLLQHVLGGVYRDQAYVESETRSLAEQLSTIK